MDTSVFAVDLTPWLSHASEILYVVSAGLALFVVVLSCMVGHNMTAHHTDSPKRRGHAHTPSF